MRLDDLTVAKPSLEDGEDKGGRKKLIVFLVAALLALSGAECSWVNSL